jgi:hypothetical protein
MATIQATYDPFANLTLFAVQGVVSADELIDACTAQLSTQATDNVIWEFHDVDLSQLDYVGLYKIAEYSKETEALRTSPKTAFVAQGKVQRILLKLYTEVAAHAELRTTFRIFADRDDALVWLHGSDERSENRL